MSDNAIVLDHVSKKFTKGERHDSLRDLIPALTRKALRRGTNAIDLKPREFWALDDLSFTIKQGESVGIIGHNGAGKSTLLKHLSGLMRPTKGRIQVQGRLSALIEVGAGFHQDLTGRENIFLNGVILGMSRNEVRRKLDEIIEFSGLADFIDTPVKRYSSGMYARLGFSVAAHMEPDILIVDEVLSVGDLAFQTRGIEKMRSILARGTTVLFVSHNMRSMVDLCSRSLLMRRGRLMQDGPTSDVINSYMRQMSAQRQVAENQVIAIESVSVFGVDQPDRPRVDFMAGDKAIVEIRFRAIQRVEKISCALYLNDNRFTDIFNTSSERLGVPSMTLEPGEVRVCRYEVTLHLAAGNYNVCAAIVRYDTQHLYDDFSSGITVLIRSDKDVLGIANLYPEVAILPG